MFYPNEKLFKSKLIRKLKTKLIQKFKTPTKIWDTKENVMA